MKNPVVAISLSVTTALVMVACGSASSRQAVTQSATSATAFGLYVREGRSAAAHLTMVDPNTGGRTIQLPGGLMAADGSRLYAVDSASGQSVLRALDPVSGRTLAQMALPSHFELPQETASGLPGGLSPNGRWLAVAAPTSAGHSRFLVVETTLAAPGREIDLPGTFTFDGLSNDGGRLYLIQDLGQGQYQVRLYSVRGAGLAPDAIFDKREGPGPMRGMRLASEASADGSHIFSLYINGKDGPFVHALGLDDQWSTICMELPATGRDDLGKQMLWSLAPSADRKTLYAVNAALGLVAQIDTAQARIVRQASFSPAPAASAWTQRFVSGGAALSPDGHTLYAVAGSGLLSLRTDTLKQPAYRLAGWPLDSLAVSPTGGVYAVSVERRRLLRFDGQAQELGFELPSPEQPWALGTTTAP